MTLGELIRILERKDPTANIEFDWIYCRPVPVVCSYREDYAQLALNYSDNGQGTVILATKKLFY